ncbi:hypothetical protein B0H19DRAFT_1233033 [Mycena capillaripes]|nr:hypothetical protein B0H19DRAFT_1233033 [Mycena capillaripes]
MPSPPNNTLGSPGAMEIGTFISYILFGVMTTQVYTYYGRFPNDSRKLKFLASGSWKWILYRFSSISMAHLRFHAPGPTRLSAPDNNCVRAIYQLHNCLCDGKRFDNRDDIGLLALSATGRQEYAASPALVFVCPESQYFCTENLSAGTTLTLITFGTMRKNLIWVAIYIVQARRETFYRAPGCG